MIIFFYRLLFFLSISAAVISSFFPVFGNLSNTEVGVESFEIRLDYLIHALGYFLFCMYYLAGQRRGFMLFKRRPLVKFILLMLLIVTGTEVVQLWVPERAFNPYDIASNATGLVLGVVVILILRRKETKKA